MATLLFDGQAAPLSSLGMHDGLGYGRFDAPGLEVHSYEFFVSSGELAVAMSEEFDALVAEMREDDLLVDERSAFQRMEYPTLRHAFRHPKELEEVIDTFLHHDILVRFVPFSDRSEFVINSTDEIRVTESGVTLAGRCFRVRRP